MNLPDLLLGPASPDTRRRPGTPPGLAQPHRIGPPLRPHQSRPLAPDWAARVTAAPPLAGGPSLSATSGRWGRGRGAAGLRRALLPERDSRLPGRRTDWCRRPTWQGQRPTPCLRRPPGSSVCSLASCSLGTGHFRERDCACAPLSLGRASTGLFYVTNRVCDLTSWVNPGACAARRKRRGEVRPRGRGQL